MQHVKHADGSLIFLQGEAARRCFIVIKGTVKIYKLLSDGRRQILGFLFPGDVLGLHDGDCYSHCAEALGEAVLHRFPASKLDAPQPSLRFLQHRMLSNAVHELMEAQEHLVLLGRMTARERLVRFLLRLAAQARARGETSEWIALPMSRQDIADYLGLTIETVSRTFGELKAEGAVEVGYRKVRLIEPERLDSLAQPETIG